MGIVGRLKTSRYLRVLRSAEKVSPQTLAEAKGALRAIGPAALPCLFEVLSHREARAPAQEVLESLLEDRTLPAFVSALRSPDPPVRAAVVEVLQRGKHYHPERLLDSLAGADIPKAPLEAVLLERLDSLSAGHLLEILPGLDRDGRAVVFRLIEVSRDPSIASAAAALLHHEDWWIRLHMAKLLAAIPGEAAEKGLAGALGDRNRSVRLQAARSLHALGARSAVPPLVKALRDGDLTVQAAAIDALIGIGDPGAVPHLVDVLKDESEQARRGAVEVLNEVATTEAIQDLVHALRDADWWVRVRSADALGTIGGEKVVEAILGLMDDEDIHIRRYAVEILNTIPDGRSVESLLKALRDEDWWVRERSIDALGHSGDERALAPLVDLLATDKQVAPLCARALGELRDPRAVDPLLAVLSSRPEEELSREVVDALVKIAAGGEIPERTRGRMEAALKEFGIRLEKTRLRPMEVRKAPAESPESISLVLEKPLERPDPGPAPELARPDPGSDRAPPGDEPRRRPTRTIRPEDITEGTVLLERYRVIRKIGSGGFSTVFLVEDQAISDELILKILSSHLLSDENMAQRFVRELKLARRISHRNVIRIHDLLQIGRSRVISMEYFESQDLGQIIDEQDRLSAARGVHISRQICSGLAAAHQAGVIHRDVKPANVLVNRDDEVKIVDFGLASVGQGVENRLTRTGHLVGTPHYMAPELIRGEEVGTRADLYSFGIMMYEMFSGRLPYDGDNPMNVLFRHLDGDAEPLGGVAPGISEGLARLVMRAMALEPEERPESARDLLRELEMVEG